MKVITVYGILKGQTIHTEDKDYQLSTKNTLKCTYKGWFQIEKSENGWRLWRTLFQDWADSYIDDDGNVVNKVADSSS